MGRKISNRRKNFLKKHKKKCAYCNNQVGSRSGTRDHFVPRSKGGTGSKNIKLACKRCNGVKGDIDGNRWMEMLPSLLEAGYMQMTKPDRRRWRKENPGVFPVTWLY